MAGRQALILLLLPVALAGCSSMPERTGSAGAGGLEPERLEAARRARHALEQSADSADAPPGADRRAELREKLWEFEREAIRRAVRLEQQDAWDQAKLVLEQAVEAVPDSRILSSALAQFDRRRAAREEVLRAELAIHQGEQLLKDAEAYRRLERVKGGGLFTWLEGRDYRHRRKESAAALRGHADNALGRQDYYLARRCLALAVQLDTGEHGARERLRQLDRKIAEIRGRAIHHDPDRPERTSGGRLQAQIAELIEALEAGRLLDVQKRLEVLQRRHPDNDRLQALALELNGRVRQAIEKGKVLYSEGKVEQALELWREMQPLDPENIELRSSISRAEKVLQNLRVLSDDDPDGRSS